jgi:hypothetical protein
MFLVQDYSIDSKFKVVTIQMFNLKVVIIQMFTI